MNRAILERMRSYQPRPGIAERAPNAFSVAFWALAVAVVSVVVPSCLMIKDNIP